VNKPPVFLERRLVATSHHKAKVMLKNIIKNSASIAEVESLLI